MVYKEKKLAILIYLLRYGRMTEAEVRQTLSNNFRSTRKDFEKLCSIPGIFTDQNRTIIYSFYYILSHRIPVFYDHEGKAHNLRDVKTKSPPLEYINSSSNDTLRAHFS